VTKFGWGVGGSALVPILPKFLDLQGSVMYGKGIGRYGSGQLPDVTIAPDGSLSPVTALHAMVGAVAHFTPDLDVYAYAGLEKADSNFSTATNGVPNNTGFGNPFFVNTLCGVENSAAVPAVPGSPVSGVLANGSCAVNVRLLTEITAGFWYNFYKGPMGRVAGGAQFEYIHRDSYPGVTAPIGIPVAPSTDNAIAMASLRYYFP
jgi:hypothetical protein